MANDEQQPPALITDPERVTGEFAALTAANDDAAHALVDHWLDCTHCHTGVWCKEGRRLVAESSGQGGEA